MNKTIEWFLKIFCQITGFYFLPKEIEATITHTPTANVAINKKLFLELNIARNEVASPELPATLKNSIDINIGRVIAKSYKESLISKTTCILISDNDLSKGGIKIDRLDDSFYAIKKYIVNILTEQGFDAKEYQGSFIQLDSNDITAVLDSKKSDLES